MKIRIAVSHVAVCLTLAATGCPFGPIQDLDTGEYEDPTAEDVAEYDALQLELDGARKQVLESGAGNPNAVGDTLFWLTSAEWNPSLHSWSAETEEQIDYAFSIGGGDDTNYRASGEAVATAAVESGQVRYSIYDVNAEEELLGDILVEAPKDEQKFWAYALDGTTLYFVTTGDETTLKKFVPGGEVETVTTLESAGCEVGEFWDFDIRGGSAIFIESGRLWRLDLAANEATWLENQTEVTTVDYDDERAIYMSALGPFRFDYASGVTTDIAAGIAESSYTLNETYSTSHLFYQEMAVWESWFVYIGQSGVFAYDLSSGEVAPILLVPREGDVRIAYRYPVTFEDGTLFVTGLESESGAVGAEGPIYSIHLDEVLP